MVRMSACAYSRVFGRSLKSFVGVAAMMAALSA